MGGLLWRACGVSFTYLPSGSGADFDRGLDEPAFYVVKWTQDPPANVIVEPEEALTTRIVPVREIKLLGDVAF